MTTPRDDPRSSPPSRRRTSLRFAAWSTAALLTAAGGWAVLGAHAAATGSSSAAAPTSFATPSLLPAPAPAPAPSPPASRTSPAAPSSPPRAATASALRDEFAGPASDAQLQQLMNASYPRQYRGRGVKAAVKAAWTYQANDLAAGGYTHTHLQATAITNDGTEQGTPTRLTVVLMWSGTYPVTGWVERQLATITLAHRSRRWVVDSG